MAPACNPGHRRSRPGRDGTAFPRARNCACVISAQQHPSSPNTIPPSALVVVPQYCVDELIRQSNLPRVDLLLADIQGAELEMLHGATDSIDRGLLRFIFVSTHHHAISNNPLIHQQCVEFIRAHKGHILIEHNVTESFSGDGLIVASFDPADRQLPPIQVSRNWPSNSLFRESEYDLAEACAAIEELGQEFVGLVRLNPQMAAELNRIRQKNRTLSRNWPEFA